MAQLTWRNIEAPQLSNRDLVLAGGQLSQSFDRLGQSLAAREENLRKQATDSAIAARLVQQDPNAIGQLELAGLDKRVDLRALAEADNSHRGALIQRAKQQDDLLNSQAMSQFGSVIEGLGTAALNGDKDAEAKIREGRESDPMFARALAQTWDKIVGFRDDHTDNVLEQDKFGETKADNQRQAADRAAGRALQARQIGNDEKRQREADEGFILAREYADNLRLTDTTSARAELEDRLKNSTHSAGVQRAILANFEPAHKALTTETEATRRGFAETDQTIKAVDTGLQAEANRAENRAKDPELASTRRSLSYGDDLKRDQVDTALDGRLQIGRLENGHAVVEKVLSQVKGASHADVQAAIDNDGYDAGWRQYVPVLNDMALADADKRLTERVQKIVDQKAAGYTANEALDVANARAPAESRAAQIKAVRARMGLYARANEPVPDELTQKLDELLSRRSK